MFDPVQTTGLTAAHGPALFFSVVLSYTVPILHYISARTVDAIGDLRAEIETLHLIPAADQDPDRLAGGVGQQIVVTNHNRRRRDGSYWQPATT